MALEEQLAALAKAIADGQAANETRLDAIQQLLDLWRPAVQNLQGQLDELRTQVGRIALHPALVDRTPATEEQLGRPAPTPPSVVLGHHGPSGHNDVRDYRGQAHGVVTTLQPPPTNGASDSNPFPPRVFSGLDLVEQRKEVEHRGWASASHANWALPKVDFPPFDGDNPQFWRTRCEKYFEVYGVQQELWVRLATLHFTGNAARWLQLQEAKHGSLSWEGLCSGLCEKFGREQYQAHIRQFNTLRQRGTVSEYMAQFEELMHHILAHNSGFDSGYFTTLFLEGLRHDIRAGVMLHQPKDLDSAFSLASMQEELLEAMPRREYRRQEAPNRQGARPLLALADPPARQMLHGPPAAAEDRRAVDAANVQDQDGRGDDRVAALRNYRRARGLCFKCGERWHY
ncbi:hypothetical protein VPH35_107448 [Triticum aestivum]